LHWLCLKSYIVNWCIYKYYVCYCRNTEILISNLKKVDVLVYLPLLLLLIMITHSDNVSKYKKCLEIKLMSMKILKCLLLFVSLFNIQQHMIRLFRLCILAVLWWKHSVWHFSDWIDVNISFDGYCNQIPCSPKPGSVTKKTLKREPNVLSKKML
jgi:hypothetical protein